MGVIMILTDRQIREACEKGDIVIEPFDDEQIEPATYDLRVGDQGATTSAKRRINIKETGSLVLAPGDFGVVTVLEEIRLGLQYAARFGLRSKYARKGLIATTGPQIDPGYHGRLVVGLTNLTPRSVPLTHQDDFVSVEFHRLEEPVTKPYDGPYQGKVRLDPEDIEMVLETEAMALSDVMNMLRSLSENVGVLSRELSTLRTDLAALAGEFRAYKWAVPIIVAFGIAIMSIIAVLK